MSQCAILPVPTVTSNDRLSDDYPIVRRFGADGKTARDQRGGERAAVGKAKNANPVEEQRFHSIQRTVQATEKSQLQWGSCDAAPAPVTGLTVSISRIRKPCRTDWYIDKRGGMAHTSFE